MSDSSEATFVDINNDKPRLPINTDDTPFDFSAFLAAIKVKPRGANAVSSPPSSYPFEFDDEERLVVDDAELYFSLLNVPAPFANALRRILLSEVPTMAIEKVFISK